MSESNQASPESCECPETVTPVESALPLRLRPHPVPAVAGGHFADQPGRSFFISNSARETC